MHEYKAKKLIFSSSVKSNFFYFPLIWMFCKEHSIARTSNIQERCLRLIQRNYTSDFQILSKDANGK